jgi:hypothetical protein
MVPDYPEWCCTLPRVSARSVVLLPPGFPPLPGSQEVRQPEFQYFCCLFKNSPVYIFQIPKNVMNFFVIFFHNSLGMNLCNRKTTMQDLQLTEVQRKII